MSYTGSTRRNTVFIFVWLRHRNTPISIQHVGRGRGVPCAVVVQYHRNDVGIAGGGGGNSLMIGSFIKCSARPPTRAWEVARTVVAAPSSVVQCLWEVFVWGFVLVVCVCVSLSGVLFSVGVCAPVTC